MVGTTPSIEQVGARICAVAQLDDGRLAADRVGRAVEDLRGGQATGELPVEGERISVENVLDADLGGHRVAALVDAFRRRVAVGVDQAGGQSPSRWHR